MLVHEEFNAFVRENQEIWTPRDIFDTCCVKWLVDGREKPFASHYQSYFLDEMNDGNVVGKGCDYCSLAHPEITLSFDETKRVTVVTLSHLLDPFVKVMEDQVKKGTARKKKEGVYSIDGFLGDVAQTIRKGNHIGKHLVTAKKSDVLASKRARQETAKEKQTNDKSANENKDADKKRAVDQVEAKDDRPAKQFRMDENRAKTVDSTK